MFDAVIVIRSGKVGKEPDQIMSEFYKQRFSISASRLVSLSANQLNCHQPYVSMNHWMRKWEMLRGGG